LACLHDQNESGFFGGPVFSSHQRFLKTFQDWLDKSRPSKQPLILIM